MAPCLEGVTVAARGRRLLLMDDRPGIRAPCPPIEAARPGRGRIVRRRGGAVATLLDVRERETDPTSFLGIVEGFPQILTCSTSVEQTERDLVNALEEHLRRLMDHEATRIQLDDSPTVQFVRLHLAQPVARLESLTGISGTLSND